MARQEPETRERYRHFVSITTRWMDNDVYRHVNNAVYYSFFDTAVNEYMVRAGVGLRVARLGTSSVRFEIGVFRNGEGRAAAQGHFVHVACDRATQRPVPMPPEMRTALEKLRA